MAIEPKIDFALLKETSKVLRDLLIEYSASQADARFCLEELQPIFDLIDKDQIVSPRQQSLPCGYDFHEGSLRPVPGLETAYCGLSMALEGMDDDALEELFRSIGLSDSPKNILILCYILSF